MALPPDAGVASAWREEMLGGVRVLLGQGTMPDGNAVRFVAVPYFAWQNRGIAALATLLIEDRARLESEKAPVAKPMNTDG